MNEIIKNDEMMCSDDFPESLRRFSENINKKNPGLHSENHNLYLLQTTDRDGNVTGEAYGMNLMTNFGFNIMYYTHELNGYYVRFTSDAYIFIGNGTDEPVLTNNALYSPIITTGSTYVSITRSYYPFTYNSNTDIATVRLKNYQGYFDYNLSGITEDKEITEIGYGKSTTQLFTHTKIYDSEGNPSSITKRINERLTITMYIACCCKMSIIENAYNNKIYMFLNPRIFEPATSQVYDSSTRSGYYCGGFGRDTHLVYFTTRNSKDCVQIDTSAYNSSMHLFRSDLRQQIDDNLIIGKAKINSERFFLESNNQYVSNMIYSTSSLDKYNTVGSCSFYIIKPIQLSEPEELVSTDISTNSITSSLITDEFGLKSSSLPCTNFNITSLSMYNHLTKEWDIEESYLNDSNTDYNSTFYIAGSLWITFQGKSITAYVFTNIRTDLPITSFNNSNIVLYATDKYWDTSTWVLISNIGNVDESLQCKRYYIITNENLVCLYPQRNMVYHQIVTKQNQITLPVPPAQTAYGKSNFKPLSNDKYGWILGMRHLIYPDTENGCIYYQLTTINNDLNPGLTSWRWTTEEGDKILIACWYQDTNTKLYDVVIRIYDTTDPTQTPSYIDVTLDFGSQIPSNHSCNILMNDSGFLSARVYATSSGETKFPIVVLDVYGDGEGPTQHIVQIDGIDNPMNIKYHVFLNRSDNIVLVHTDNKTIYVYNMKSKTVIKTFKVPQIYTISCLVGWKDYIYMRVYDTSDTYSTLFYNIKTDEYQMIMTDYPQITSENISNMYMLSTDECLMIDRPDSNHTGLLIKESDLLNPFVMDWSFYGFGSSASLRYINDGKQLYYISTKGYYGESSNSSVKFRHSRIYVYDVGYRIDNNQTRSRDIVVPETYLSGYGSNNSTTEQVSSVCFYRDWVCYFRTDGLTILYPIENCVYHKIVGTTTTIQSYNNPKQLSGLTFSLSITNDMNRTSVDTTPTTDEST